MQYHGVCNSLMSLNNCMGVGIAEQISGVKVYRADNQTADEVIMECDFMWAGQQVSAPSRIITIVGPSELYVKAQSTIICYAHQDNICAAEELSSVEHNPHPQKSPCPLQASCTVYRRTYKFWCGQCHALCPQCLWALARSSPPSSASR